MSNKEKPLTEFAVINGVTVPISSEEMKNLPLVVKLGDEGIEIGKVDLIASRSGIHTKVTPHPEFNRLFDDAFFRWVEGMLEQRSEQDATST